MSIPVLGFIILRCVRVEADANYWITCGEAIRRLHPTEPILIIDDGSTPQLIKKMPPLLESNVSVVSSTFPNRGELLPYYYFHKLRPFARAVFVHDSVILQKPVSAVEDVGCRFLWHFPEHQWDNPGRECALLKTLKNNEPLCALYAQNSKWVGCFGVMSIVSWAWLDALETKYSFTTTLLHFITTRHLRSALERVFAVLTFAEGCHPDSLFGPILSQPKGFGMTYELYLLTQRLLEITSDTDTLLLTTQLKDLPAVKTWTWRR